MLLLILSLCRMTDVSCTFCHLQLDDITSVTLPTRSVSGVCLTHTHLHRLTERKNMLQNVTNYSSGLTHR